MIDHILPGISRIIVEKKLKKWEFGERGSGISERVCVAQRRMQGIPVPIKA